MLSFTDVMIAVKDMEAAADALAGLVGFAIEERTADWIALCHPDGARIVLVEKDFGAACAVACRAGAAAGEPFAQHGMTPPDPQRLREAGHCLIGGESGLNLLLYG